MQLSKDLKIDVKYLLELIKNLDDLYETYYQAIINYCVHNQLEKIVRKDSIESITTMLNQMLDICLKNESIRKVIIRVSQLVEKSSSSSFFPSPTMNFLSTLILYVWYVFVRFQSKTEYSSCSAHSKTLTSKTYSIWFCERWVSSAAIWSRSRAYKKSTVSPRSPTFCATRWPPNGPALSALVA